MLADSISVDPRSGRLDPEIHCPATVKLEIVKFIADQLPGWRDHPDRPTERAETALTGQLCEHLNSIARCSTTWSHIQFRTETRDETCRNRTIDLTVKPLATVLVIEGRRHCQFDALFPIECKRLPTPKEKKRDEREYVTNRFGSTGGIQRFKFGHHGAEHTFVAMIAYVQAQSLRYWLDQVNDWIQELFAEPNSIWNNGDMLQLLSDNLEAGICILESEHKRIGGLEACNIRHLWISMS